MEANKIIKDKYLDKFPFIQTEFGTGGDPDIIFATKVRTSLSKKDDNHFAIHFFMIYRGDINKELEYLIESEGFYSDNLYKDIEEQIIISGLFYLSHDYYHNPTLYFDRDLDRRTPTREHLSDWMLRFATIQNFIFEYSCSNSNYKLPIIEEEKFNQIIKP